MTDKPISPYLRDHPIRTPDTGAARCPECLGLNVWIGQSSRHLKCRGCGHEWKEADETGQRGKPA